MSELFSGMAAAAEYAYSQFPIFGLLSLLALAGLDPGHPRGSAAKPSPGESKVSSDPGLAGGSGTAWVTGSTPVKVNFE
jgi:hypothetical protein